MGNALDRGNSTFKGPEALKMIDRRVELAVLETVWSEDHIENTRVSLRSGRSLATEGLQCPFVELYPMQPSQGTGKEWPRSQELVGLKLT